MAFPYAGLWWDISGTCNAACKYCPSGTRYPGFQKPSGKDLFLSAETFEKALHLLMEKGIVIPHKTGIGLYNWGEPFLNPELPAITEILAKNEVRFGLSTNVSLYRDIPPISIPFLYELTLSVSGFSQESYDRGHGFSFPKIRENLVRFATYLQAHSETQIATMVFHVYRHNMHEVEAARQFCAEHHIRFVAYHAYMCGIAMPLAYLDQSMNPEVRKQVEADLILPDFQSQKATNSCRQFHILTLDHQCNILLCCVADRNMPGAILGNIFRDDIDQIMTRKPHNPICKSCLERGISQVAHNPQSIG